MVFLRVVLSQGAARESVVVTMLVVYVLSMIFLLRGLSFILRSFLPHEVAVLGRSMCDSIFTKSYEIDLFLTNGKDVVERCKRALSSRVPQIRTLSLEWHTHSTTPRN